MFFLFSGEGVTDMGAGKTGTQPSRRRDFFVGPMAMIVDQVVEQRLTFPFSIFGGCGYVSESSHRQAARSRLEGEPRKNATAREKRGKETGYFFNNARILSRIAKEQASKRNDDVVAVLFRDSDGTASAGRGFWEEKRQSMLDGFDEEKFAGGADDPKTEIRGMADLCLEKERLSELPRPGRQFGK